MAYVQLSIQMIGLVQESSSQKILSSLLEPFSVFSLRFGDGVLLYE